MHTQSLGISAFPMSHFMPPARPGINAFPHPTVMPSHPIAPAPHGFLPPPRPGFMPPHVAIRANPALQAQILQRNREAFRQREVARFMQQRMTREQALIAANASLSAQNANLQAQAAQQAAAQSVPAAPMPVAQPTAAVSPASPSADLTPQQDASDGGGGADAAAAAPEPMPHAHKSHLLLFAGLAVGAGVGGYFLLKKKRAATKS